MAGLIIILIDLFFFCYPFLDGMRIAMPVVSFFEQLYSGILCQQNAFLLELMRLRCLLSLGSF